MKESMIQFSKPKKMINPLNPGSHFMSMTTFDAREAMIPGSIYDRSSAMNGSSTQAFFRPQHDPLSYMTPDRSHGGFPSLPVPIGMFMNMAAQQQFNMNRGGQTTVPPSTRHNTQNRKPRNRQSSQQTSSQSSQGDALGISDSGPLTQVPLSMSQSGLMSQGNPYPGFSQSEGLSQVTVDTYDDQLS